MAAAVAVMAMAVTAKAEEAKPVADVEGMAEGAERTGPHRRMPLGRTPRAARCARVRRRPIRRRGRASLPNQSMHMGRDRLGHQRICSQLATSLAQA